MMANQKSHHLMTLSARASTLGGIVRPSCLAVFRLIDELELSSAAPLANRRRLGAFDRYPIRGTFF